MLLGTLITRLQQDGEGDALLAATGDLILQRRVDEAAAEFGETPGDFIAGVVRRFADGAADEEWTGLMGALERGGDPATACLKRMLDWAMRQPPEAEHGAEGCGGAHCTCQHG